MLGLLVEGSIRIKAIRMEMVMVGGRGEILIKICSKGNSSSSSNNNRSHNQEDINKIKIIIILILLIIKAIIIIIIKIGLDQQL
jgi:Trk-type K+ transport system membrane component